MKRNVFALSLGLSTALLLTLAMPPLVDVAEAQQKRVNFNQKKGNWNQRAVRRPAPPRQNARGPIEFFNIFRPRRAEPQRQATPGQAGPRRLFVPPAAGAAAATAAAAAQSGRAAANPRLISPETAVEEYVEKPKIYVYPEPQLLPVRDANLAGNASSPQAAAILDVLRTGAARVEASAGDRRAILAFYKARGFAPVWSSGGQVNGRAQDVLGLLARAHEHGLNNLHYRVPVVWENAGDATAFNGNAHALARLDVELTTLALRYARHISGGIADPNKLSAYHDLKPPKVRAPEALKKLAEAANPATWLESLAPRHFAYRQMKRELARLGNAPQEELLPPIPTGRLIRPGMRDERMALIRQHLARLGLLPAAGAAPRTDVLADTAIDPTAGEVSGNQAQVQSVALDAPQAAAAAATADPLLYDKAVEKAVRAFQRQAGLKPDGLIGKGTIRAFNRRNSTDTKGARIAKLQLNMERLRWMPRDFGDPHYLVNVPAFEVYLYEGGKVRWKSRVVTGKKTNQTYFFSDRIRYVEFNPYWGVPQSIIRKEFIPKLIKNPYWLDQEGYEVRDRKGRVISSASVDWARWRNAKVIPFSIRQLPGDKNALGRLKVMFPNKHAIYLHDTPFKSLFNRSRRAFSHGCVRVQKPTELAELVLGIDSFEVEQYLKAGKNKQVRLKKPIPVHLAYFTAWPDDNGRMRYYDDVYGRDALLKTALKKHDAAYVRIIRQAGLR